MSVLTGTRISFVFDWSLGRLPDDCAEMLAAAYRVFGRQTAHVQLGIGERGPELKVEGFAIDGDTSWQVRLGELSRLLGTGTLQQASGGPWGARDSRDAESRD